MTRSCVGIPAETAVALAQAWWFGADECLEVELSGCLLVYLVKSEPAGLGRPAASKELPVAG